MTSGNSGMYTVTVVLPRLQSEFGVSRADASLPYTLTTIGLGVGDTSRWFTRRRGIAR